METSTSAQSDASFNTPGSRVAKGRSAQPTGNRSATLSQKTFQLSFRSMSGLLDILVTLSRLGSSLDYVSARANSAIIAVSANPFVLKRIPSLLRELIEVMELNELE